MRKVWKFVLLDSLSLFIFFKWKWFVVDPLASIELALELEPVKFHHMQETVAPLYPNEPNLRESQESVTPEHQPENFKEPIFRPSEHAIL